METLIQPPNSVIFKYTNRTVVVRRYLLMAVEIDSLSLWINFYGDDAMLRIQLPNEEVVRLAYGDVIASQSPSSSILWIEQDDARWRRFALDDGNWIEIGPLM